MAEKEKQQFVVPAGGEWPIGPSLLAKYSPALLWITTISALLQVFLNLNSLSKKLSFIKTIHMDFNL